MYFFELSNLIINYIDEIDFIRRYLSVLKANRFQINCFKKTIDVYNELKEKKKEEIYEYCYNTIQNNVYQHNLLESINDTKSLLSKSHELDVKIISENKFDKNLFGDFFKLIFNKKYDTKIFNLLKLYFINDDIIYMQKEIKKYQTKEDFFYNEKEKLEKEKIIIIEKFKKENIDINKKIVGITEEKERIEKEILNIKEILTKKEEENNLLRIENEKNTKEKNKNIIDITEEKKKIEKEIEILNNKLIEKENENENNERENMRLCDEKIKNKIKEYNEIIKKKDEYYKKCFDDNEIKIEEILKLKNNLKENEEKLDKINNEKVLLEKTNIEEKNKFDLMMKMRQNQVETVFDEMKKEKEMFEKKKEIFENEKKKIEKIIEKEKEKEIKKQEKEKEKKRKRKIPSILPKDYFNFENIQKPEIKKEDIDVKKEYIDKSENIKIKNEKEEEEETYTLEELDKLFESDVLTDDYSLIDTEKFEKGKLKENEILNLNYYFVRINFVMNLYKNGFEIIEFLAIDGELEFIKLLCEHNLNLKEKKNVLKLIKALNDSIENMKEHDKTKYEEAKKEKFYMEYIVENDSKIEEGSKIFMSNKSKLYRLYKINHPLHFLQLTEKYQISFSFYNNIIFNDFEKLNNITNISDFYAFYNLEFLYSNYDLYYLYRDIFKFWKERAVKYLSKNLKNKEHDFLKKIDYSNINIKVDDVKLDDKYNVYIEDEKSNDLFYFFSLFKSEKIPLLYYYFYDSLLLIEEIYKKIENIDEMEDIDKDIFDIIKTINSKIIDVIDVIKDNKNLLFSIGLILKDGKLNIIDLFDLDFDKKTIRINEKFNNQEYFNFK